MTQSQQHITESHGPPTERVVAPVRDPSRVMLDYLTDLLTPAFNQLRAAYGIEPEPPRPGPPVTAEEAKAAADDFYALEALRAEQAKAELAEWKTIMGHAEKPRSPTLARVAKQLRNAEIAVARLEQKPDGTIVVITAQGEQHQGNELDDWMANHARAPQGH